MASIKLTRRQFLKTTAAGGLAAAAPGLWFTGTAHAQTPTDTVLVNIHLHGGNDHLNTLVPYNDPLYYQYRPTLALSADAVLPLDATFGLNPVMEGFLGLYDTGQVAIVPGVGYPEFSRSHFRAIDIYDGADPVGTPTTGWLGRYLDQLASSATMQGVYVGTAVPLSLAAASVPLPAVPGAEEYTYQTSPLPADADAQTEAAVAVFTQASIGEAFFDTLLAQDQAALESIALVQQAAAGYETGVSYGDDELSQHLKLAAQLIHSDLGVRVIGTELNGFDTHSDQLDTHADLLAQLSQALDSFMQDAAAGGFDHRVVVQVFSEFGRRVAENASGGTDHGTASPIILVGAPVSGGIHGPGPDLTDLDDNGDLRMSTDFRSVYATVLRDWLGADPAAVLGQDWPTLALFA